MLPSVVQYINSVWLGRHPPGEMGLRNLHEMKLMGEMLDQLVAGNLSRVGDLMMQRLKAIEQATKDGHWNVAQFLEVGGLGEIGLATQGEVKSAVRAQMMDYRLRESTSRSGKLVP
jgi:hypothetical protein